MKGAPALPGGELEHLVLSWLWRLGSVEAVESADPELLDELARVVAARRESRRGT